MPLNSFLRRFSNPDNNINNAANATPIMDLPKDDFNKIPKTNPIHELIKHEKYHRSSDNLHVSL